MADKIVTQDANANQADRIAPWTPSGDAWGGLARDVVMWLDIYQERTPRSLLKHLDRVGTEIPMWLLDEPEMKNLDHALSKGTRAVIIYRAMLQDCPAAAAPVKVPVGWKLVREEPTTGVRCFVESRALDFGIDFDKFGGDEAIDALYRSMIAAHPPAPSVSPAAEVVGMKALEKCADGFAALTKLLTGGPVYEGGKRVGMSALAVHSRAGEQCAREALSVAATAPDLRYTLENLLRAIDGNSGNEPSVSALGRAIDEARAALRKAGVTGNG